MLGLRPRSPLVRLLSSSVLSRLISENSLATNRPVPIVNRMPRQSNSHSFIGYNLEEGRGGDGLSPYPYQHTFALAVIVEGNKAVKPTVHKEKVGLFGTVRAKSKRWFGVRGQFPIWSRIRG